MSIAVTMDSGQHRLSGCRDDTNCAVPARHRRAELRTGNIAADRGSKYPGEKRHGSGVIKENGRNRSLRLCATACEACNLDKNDAAHGCVQFIGVRPLAGHQRRCPGHHLLLDPAWKALQTQSSPIAAIAELMLKVQAAPITSQHQPLRIPPSMPPAPNDTAV